jgi:flagellar motor switch protein FliN/FliY
MPDTTDQPENAFLGVPVEMTISVGKAKPLISELLSLSQGAIIPLDSRIEDPVEVYIGDKLIAKGELQEIEGEAGKLGVRLTQVVDLQNGF